MFTNGRLGFILVISFIALTAVKAKSKYYDGEIRPYEFGYRVEGNQHRHEKKDENGIINGDFGFITGNGAYHSSVYATDENGNFKLISLKSSFRKVKSTTTTAATTAVIAAVTTVPSSITVTNAPISRAPKSLKTRSCSNCKVIEKETYDNPSSIAPDAIEVTVKGEDVSDHHNQIVGPKAVLTTSKKNSAQLYKTNEDIPKMKVKSNVGTVTAISPLNIALGISTAGIRASEQIRLKHKQRDGKDKLKETTNGGKATKDVSPLSIPLSISNDGLNISEDIKINQKNKPQTESISLRSNGINNIPANVQTKSDTNLPVSTDGTNQRTGKTLEQSKTKISSKNAIQEFIGDVLYRFNYTAGYHGHNEEGDSVGNKRGGYFIVGRDNIRRGVIYVANGNGFIPVVKYEKVSPAEAPHEDTEKNAGLRGYEFEWFHKGKSKISDSSTK